jgi:hypothetical protein
MPNHCGADRKYSRVDEVQRINCGMFTKFKGKRGIFEAGGQKFVVERIENRFMVFTDVKHTQGYTFSIEYVPTINHRLSPFFRCPNCDARRRYLYLNKTYWFCRKCSKLKYESQNGTKIDYLVEAVRQKRRQVFGDEVYKAEDLGDLSNWTRYIPKPKWRRYEKWERDRQALFKLEQKYEREFCRRTAAFLGMT